MSSSRRNAVPIYKTIQSSIRNHIASANLKPGDAVLSERELAKTYKVSLMTARHALADLESEGIVERIRGVGTFVAMPKIHFNKLMSYSEQMLSRGLNPRSQVLTAKIIKGETEIAARLGVSAADRLIKIHRVRLAGKEPFALETCYLHASDFPGLELFPSTKNSLFATVENDFSTNLTYADEEVDATIADNEIAKTLHIPPGAPVLRIRQTIFSAQGKAVIYVLGFYRSERHTLFVRRFR